MDDVFVMREDPSRRGLWWLLDARKLWSGYGTFARDAEALAARVGPFSIGERRTADDGSAYWTMRSLDERAFVASCPYALASEVGRDYRGRSCSSLRIEMLSVPDHYCAKMPETSDAMRAVRAGLSPVGKFGSCCGPTERCPRIRSTSDDLGWVLARGPRTT